MIGLSFYQAKILIRLDIVLKLFIAPGPSVFAETTGYLHAFLFWRFGPSVFSEIAGNVPRSPSLGRTDEGLDCCG